MIKKHLLLKLSITLNLILITGILYIGFKFRQKKYDEAGNQKKFEIVMFGNSLTSDGKWSRDLNRLDIKNSGTPGLTTSHFVWILNKAVIQYHPKICFIEGGINDILAGIPLNRTFNNYRSIVDTLLRNKIEPILQSTFYVNYINDSTNSFINRRVDSLNLYLTNLANKRGIEFVDLNSQLSDNGKLKKELNWDGVHLNEFGYKIWVKEVNRIIKLKGL